MLSVVSFVRLVWAIRSCWSRTVTPGALTSGITTFCALNALSLLLRRFIRNFTEAFVLSVILSLILPASKVWNSCVNWDGFSYLSASNLVCLSFSLTSNYLLTILCFFETPWLSSSFMVVSTDWFIDDGIDATALADPGCDDCGSRHILIIFGAEVLAGACFSLLLLKAGLCLAEVFLRVTSYELKLFFRAGILISTGFKTVLGLFTCSSWKSFVMKKGTESGYKVDICWFSGSASESISSSSTSISWIDSGFSWWLY